ncbi:hypothetical protein LDENG_00194450 [Lucifuga dentata]|nr:hypothetical protein LDENG_00194450 [Lucifuga dentata]
MVGDMKFPVHKVILCGSSNYFTNLFTQWSQPEEKDYELPHVTPDIMQLTIEFVYGGSIPLTEQNVYELFRVAAYFCIESLMEACCQFLKQQLCPQNCIDVWQFISQYYCPKLTHEAYLFILHHFGEVSASSGFLHLSLQELISIIQEDRLHVKQESTVFEAILRWITYSPEERGAHISQLLPKVRLALMTTDYFTNSIKHNELVMENNECQVTVKKAEVLLNILSDRIVSLDDHLARPRLPSKILLAVGGTDLLEELSSNHIKAYDVCAHRWTYVTKCEQPQHRITLGFLNGSVYCIGGWIGIQTVSSVLRFDLETRTWHEVAPMHSNRGSVGVTVLNECIYAIGGSNGYDVLDTAEYYEPETNQWTEIARMHKRRRGVSSTALHGKVYACGGSGMIGESLSSAECYSTETNQWTLIAPMSIRRADLGVVACAGLVYAMGGYNDTTSLLDSAEAYDPETNSWNAIPSMPTPRRKFGIGVIDDCIYAIGGCFTFNVTDVEFYDVNTGVWSQSREAGFWDLSLSCCVVSGLSNMAEYSAPREPIPLLDDDSGNSSEEDEDGDSEEEEIIE